MNAPFVCGRRVEPGDTGESPCDERFADAPFIEPKHLIAADRFGNGEPGIGMIGRKILDRAQLQYSLVDLREAAAKQVMCHRKCLCNGAARVVAEYRRVGFARLELDAPAFGRSRKSDDHRIVLAFVRVITAKKFAHLVHRDARDVAVLLVGRIREHALAF